LCPPQCLTAQAAKALLQKSPQHENPRLRPVKEFLGKYRRDVDASAKEVGDMIDLPTGSLHLGEQPSHREPHVDG
jgi:hypothetical protein